MRMHLFFKCYLKSEAEQLFNILCDLDEKLLCPRYGGFDNYVNAE